MMVCKMVVNMLVTLSQMYVETEGRKFRQKADGCSDDFTKFLKLLCYKNVRRMSFGHLVIGH